MFKNIAVIGLMASVVALAGCAKKEETVAPETKAEEKAVETPAKDAAEGPKTEDAPEVPESSSEGVDTQGGTVTPDAVQEASVALPESEKVVEGVVEAPTK